MFLVSINPLAFKKSFNSPADAKEQVKVVKAFKLLSLFNNSLIFSNSRLIYLSLFLKRNRVEYYDRLGEVRVKGNYEQWVKFFLSGVIETCNDSIQAILTINQLIEKDEKMLEGQTETVKRVYQYLKEHPIINIGATAKNVGLSFNTVSNAVNKLMQFGILTERTTAARNRVFEYAAYLDVLKSGT